MSEGFYRIVVATDFSSLRAGSVGTGQADSPAPGSN